MPMFTTCKVKMERIILFMRNRESTFVFRWRVSKFGENFMSSHVFVMEATTIIITLMPMFKTSRAKVEHSTVFCSRKLWIGILKDNGTCSEVLTAVLWESRTRKLCTCQSGRIFCSRYRNKCLCLASEKFVLANKSNLSLATGLASWKVSLEPC